MQCMGDLRTGVKLKKVNLSSKAPIEFELTPYEILMDDIRARNYKLRKVEAPREGRGRAFEKVRRLLRDDAAYSVQASDWSGSRLGIKARKEELPTLLFPCFEYIDIGLVLVSALSQL